MLTAENEWQRVRKLGRKVVAERRYQDARIAAQQARARLLAYGMSADQIDKLARGNRVDRADGRFDLLAPIAGTVIRDDFVTGQMVQPGDLLFEISDESRLWVEARLDPASAHRVRTGSKAQVLADGQWLPGEVIQVHHALDETTRTLSVRLAIRNPDDRLHPGQFVSVRIGTGDSGETGLLLPTAAVLRSADGDWQVFIEHEPGEFEPKEVDVIRQLGDRMLIDGIGPGTRVVTQGAFFVQSELAKSGFDVHNH
jgi:RND family efflux transporter MFP subunit